MVSKLKKGQMIVDTPIGWIIALGTLIVMVMAYLLLSGKMSNALEYIKNILRFGR